MSSLESTDELRTAYASVRSLILSEVVMRLDLAKQKPHERIKWHAKAAHAQIAKEAWRRIGHNIARLLDQESDEPVRLDAQQVAADFAIVKKFLDIEVVMREKLLRLHQTQAWRRKLSDAKAAVVALENVRDWFYAAVQPGELVPAPVQASLFQNDYKKKMTMSWINVNEQMPEDNKIVLLVVKGPLRSYHALGKHLSRYQQGLSDWDELEGDYREENDEYYWPAGWYEQAANDEEFDFFQITNMVTHWSVVPVLPAEKEL